MKTVHIIPWIHSTTAGDFERSLNYLIQLGHYKTIGIELTKEQLITYNARIAEFDKLSHLNDNELSKTIEKVVREEVVGKYPEDMLSVFVFLTIAKVLNMKVIPIESKESKYDFKPSKELEEYSNREKAKLKKQFEDGYLTEEQYKKCLFYFKNLELQEHNTARERSMAKNIESAMRTESEIFVFQGAYHTTELERLLIDSLPKDVKVLVKYNYANDPKFESILKGNIFRFQQERSILRRRAMAEFLNDKSIRMFLDKRETKPEGYVKILTTALTLKIKGQRIRTRRPKPILRRREIKKREIRPIRPK